MPNPWMIIAAVVFAASLAGGGFLYGRLKGEALCHAQAVADQKKAVDAIAASWKKSYDQLEDRYKMAIETGNVLVAQVRAKNQEVEQLQAQARQEISHVVPDTQTCRVPVSVIDRLNGLSWYGLASRPATGHPGTP